MLMRHSQNHNIILVRSYNTTMDGLIYVDVTILQKACHSIVNIITLNYVYEYCHNVVEMFSYNVLRQHSLNFPEICCNNKNMPTFSQLSPNVVETLLQLYIGSWDRTITYIIHVMI